MKPLLYLIFSLVLSGILQAQGYQSPEKFDSTTVGTPVAKTPVQTKVLLDQYDNSSKIMYSPTQFECSKVVSQQIAQKKVELQNTTDDIQIRIIERDIRNLEEKLQSLPKPPVSNNGEIKYSQ